MEENIKIIHLKNLNNFNFNTTINIPFDANANIKNVIDVNTFLFDMKTECGNSKANVYGKIGIKVLYIDTDNMTNTLFETQNFTETFLDQSITTDTILNINNCTITNNILSTEGTLKISCDINFAPIAYLNLSIKNNLQLNEMMITKKRSVTTNSISSLIDTKFDYTCNFETKDVISKILCHHSYLSPENVTSEDGYAVVQGKIVSSILYETIINDEPCLKELKETATFKQDIEINGLKKENQLDLSFVFDKFSETISTEIEEDNSIITIKNKICAYGVSLKSMSIDLIDDIYSTENVIEATTTKREYNTNVLHSSISENIINETTLADNEFAIDEVVANLNIVPEITNQYIKNDVIYFEGIITSNLTYIDENKEIKNKILNIPFVINTKVSAQKFGCIHSNVSIIDSKIKVKRGTIIEAEYCLFIDFYNYEKETYEIVDTFTIGKQIDKSKYDFQIYIAKPNETMWELCKRIRISPDEIKNYNADLPLIMNGGEKIIIKR